MLYHHHHHHPSPARPFIIICLIIIINNISSSAWRPSSDSSDLRSEFSDEERSGAGWLSWEIEIRLALRLAFICLPSDWCWHPADIQTLRNSKSSVWRGRRLVWWGEVRWGETNHISDISVLVCCSCAMVGWPLLATVLSLFLSGCFSVLRTVFIGFIFAGEWRWHRLWSGHLMWRRNSNRQTTAETGATTTSTTTPTTTTTAPATLPHSFAIKFFLDKTRPAGAQTDNGNTQQQQPACWLTETGSGLEFKIFSKCDLWHQVARLGSRQEFVNKSPGPCRHLFIRICTEITWNWMENC